MNSICFIVQESYPKDPRVRKYVNLLLAGDFKVDVISLTTDGLPKVEQINNLTIFRTGLKKKRGGLLRYLSEYFYFFFCSFFLVTRLHFKHKYSVVHINTLPDFLVFSAIIPKIFGTKILLDMHEIAPEFFQIKFNKSADSFIIKLLRFIERRSLRFANYSLTVTDAIRKKFIERGSVSEKNIDVILNVPEEVPDFCLKEFNPDKKFDIVYHGTITGLYSLDVAIHGIALIKNKYPHIRFHIFGEGQEESTLKNLTKELNLNSQIIFHGYVEHKFMKEALQNMDFGILPFRRNVFIDLSFSNKLAEFVALGIPVITTELPAVKEYFPDSSMFFFDGTPQHLAITFDEIYHAPFNAQSKAKMAYSYYEKCNWNVMSEKYLKIIDRLIEKKPSIQKNIT